MSPTFGQPYAGSGRYDVDVRYFDAIEGSCRFELSVNGVKQGDAWTASSRSGGWLNHTISNVAVRIGDEIRLTVQADGNHTGGLDYVQLKKRASDNSQE